jgi:hypothetical protein
MPSNGAENHRASNHANNAANVTLMTGGHAAVIKLPSEPKIGHLARLSKAMSVRLAWRVWHLLRRADSESQRTDVARVTERIELVDIPGVGPLYQHTFCSDDGEQLPDVIYTHGPGPVLDDQCRVE